MEKQSKVPMIYGYAVCLVAVITFLISMASIISALVDMGDPLHAERDYSKSPSLASFENYKMDLTTSSDKEATFLPDDDTLLKMYESAKEDKINSVNHRTTRTLLVNTLLLVVCIVLFLTHWRWMRKIKT